MKKKKKEENKKQPVKTVNSHDRFFNVLFSEKTEAMEFVAKTFPTKILDKLDLETLELDTTEYVDNKLRTNYSDVVYNCKYGNTQIKISLLFEHKSYIESYPHLQLLGYMLKIWLKQIKQKQKLTPVIPIIFYHGEREWKNQKFTEYFDELDDVLERFIPKFDYELIDISTFTDEKIVELFEGLQLQIGMLVMKNIFNEQKILNELDKIATGLNQLLQTEQGEQFFEYLVSYLFYATKIDTEKYVDKMRTISPNVGEKFVSTAMKLISKGKHEGTEETEQRIAFNLILKGFDNKLISEATDLTNEQINHLRKSTKHKTNFTTA